ncbi:hypothetical protein SDC9_146244 [bioreactor metagenome]|uniref:Uncharacterized protein n=1 Tax=bioreactor metagenome TaxID=1076179 RepID=A0A645EAJ0_9ZZZZ
MGECLKMVELMYDCHLRCKVGKGYGFFQSGVSATHNNQSFVLEKIGIARGTIRNSPAFEFFFAGNIQ